MSYTPTRSDATAVANDVVSRLNTPVSPAAGAVVGDKLVAIQDSLLCSVGYQGSDTVDGSTASTASGSPANVFASWTTPSLVAKKYLLIVDVHFWMSVTGTTTFQILVDGSPLAIAKTARAHASSTEEIRITWHQVFVASAGTHIIQLQWFVSAGTANTDANSCRGFTVAG